jgi:hypothetical protein
VGPVVVDHRHRHLHGVHRHVHLEGRGGVAHRVGDQLAQQQEHGLDVTGVPRRGEGVGGEVPSGPHAGRARRELLVQVDAATLRRGLRPTVDPAPLCG